MTRTCALCGKGINKAWTLVKLRGKYNPSTSHRQKPNLQWLRLPVSQQGGLSGKRIRACTKCIKALGKR
ncbi:MAG: 50S ribosomal protein L28 [Parcubacteria group bacterium]|nr:50S ribosomal protein L28 [Parcubacteria group bacterium]